MSDGVWAEYRSHKIVKAAVITGKTPWSNSSPAQVWVGDGEEFVPNEQAMANKANIGDYAVEYADGYKSVSPKAAFEDGYTRV